MKLIVLSAAALACLTPAAFAQDVPAAAATPAVAKLTIDSPIEALVADPKAMEVLAANGLADIAKHPSYDMAKGMSLRAVQPMSGGVVTEDMLTKIEAGLAAIK